MSTHSLSFPKVLLKKNEMVFFLSLFLWGCYMINLFNCSMTQPAPKEIMDVLVAN
jgi:hypothetical protein